MYKIGVVGAGHLGKIHIKILKNAEFADLVGFYDINPEIRRQISDEFNVKAFESYSDLINASDVIDIVTPTLSHYKCAKIALQAEKHIFIEKPVTHTLDEVKKLIKLTNKSGLKAQVGHVERFNPAFVEARKQIQKPRFIEVHRLAQFNTRGTDVSVILDLMIHDLDIILHLVNQPIKSINASGVSIMSNTPDIANARIEFINGCVANITASRMSLKNIRKSRFFQKDAYVSVDFLNKQYEFISLEEIEEHDPLIPIIDLGVKGKKKVIVQSDKRNEINPIEEELKSFIKSIETNINPIVDLKAAQAALQLAIDIAEQITMSQN
ncbi:MAG: Gfo/Idh/MocA family protein [Parvicellaceae bacterium]